MKGRDAMRRLFKSIGDFARSVGEADRQHTAATFDFTPAGKVWPNPPGPPPKDWAVGDPIIKPVIPSAFDGSTGTFAGIVGEKQREAIVVQRLKEFGKVAGLEWHDDEGIDANLTTWFLDNDARNFPSAPRKGKS